MRQHRPRHIDLPDDARRRANCRAYTLVMQSRGVLPRGPCEGCGAASATNHHPDYSQPRYYIRLCRGCHGALHGLGQPQH